MRLTASCFFEYELYMSAEIIRVEAKRVASCHYRRPLTAQVKRQVNRILSRGESAFTKRHTSSHIMDVL